MSCETLVVSGLPCIGKSYLLDRLCRRWNLRHIQFDALRQAWMPRTNERREAFDFGFDFYGFPLARAEFGCLFASVDRFLAFYSWQAAQFGTLLTEALARSRRDEATAILEISPFVWSKVAPNMPGLLCSVDRELHARRIRLRTGCNQAEARAMESFYSQALTRMNHRLTAYTPIHLHALSGELAFRLGQG